MSRIHQSFLIRRSIERGEPQPTTLHKLTEEHMELTMSQSFNNDKYPAGSIMEMVNNVQPKRPVAFCTGSVNPMRLSASARRYAVALDEPVGFEEIKDESLS